MSGACNTSGSEPTSIWMGTIIAKGLEMKFIKWIKTKTKNNNGSLNPDRLKDVPPLTPQKEASLRGLYYDCQNIKILFDEIDRRDKIIREMDHELWLMINKPGRTKCD